MTARPGPAAPGEGRPRWIRRLREAVTGYRSMGRQSLAALGANSVTSLVAGAVLGSLTDTFERYPGLLVLVPAAIGLRGNIYSALGSRLSTAIHTGTFRPTLRRGSVVGDNVVASLMLTAVFSLVLAVVAKVLAVAFGIEGTISVLELAVVSVVGGMLASMLVLAVTLTLVSVGERRGWDLDNMVAPIVSMSGDVLTLPALWLGTLLLGRGTVTDAVGWVAVAVGVFALAASVVSRYEMIRTIARQSLPVLAAALTLATFAGIVIQARLEIFAEYPALFVLLPAFVSSAGALGGILAMRLATQLHLGTVEPKVRPGRAARLDAAMVVVLAVPVYVLNGSGAHLVAGLLGQASPGLTAMVASALLGALLLIGFVLVVAYYGGVAAYRIGVDPDTYGIPIVTSSVDLMGAIALIGAVVALGVA